MNSRSFDINIKLNNLYRIVYITFVTEKYLSLLWPSKLGMNKRFSDILL